MALRVLTNRSLFLAVTGFATGVPLIAHELKHQLKLQLHPKTAAPAQEDVALWQSAVRTGDQRTLRAFRALAEVPVLSCVLARTLDGIVGYALTHASDVETREWVYKSFPAFREPSFEHFGALGACGDVEVFRYALGRGLASHVSPRQFGRTAYEAAKAGHLELLAFVHAYGIATFTKAIMDVAATNGHLRVVQFLHENRKEGCTRQAMSGAARNGHLDVVKFLYRNRREGHLAVAKKLAAQNGRTSCVEYLHTVEAAVVTPVARAV
ncbi:hypothetical protein PybrP1_009845 [[Pythium] brassicae (nom. inval.)]|nr:hypothetical protein PybrP1_009845 [[Pythium] brassicae (nom. inval.)]